MAQSTQQNSSKHRHDSHSTTVGRSSGWSTRKIAICALLCAEAAVLTLFAEFPLLPGVSFLKYDPSSIVALIGGFAFGPDVAIICSILPYLVHLATQSGVYGTFMAILATLTMAVPAAVIYKHLATSRGAVLALVAGALLSVFFCILGNLVITPLYLGMDVKSVAALIIPALLPFNVLKVCINALVCWLVYKPITKLLK